jgi:hypothetical protein
MDRKDRFTSVFLKAAGFEDDDENIKKHKSIWWFKSNKNNKRNKY